MGFRSCNDNPFNDGSQPNNLGNASLIDKMIGNSYEVVKHVARHLDEIKHVSANLEAVYNVSQLASAINALVNNSAFTNSFKINEVACVPHPIFDLSLGSIQEIVLVQDVVSSQLMNADSCSSLVVFRIIQDGNGNRNFVWPDVIKSHGEISLAPNAISQQMFAKNPDGTFDYINPMMYPRG